MRGVYEGIGGDVAAGCSVWSPPGEVRAAAPGRWGRSIRRVLTGGPVCATLLFLAGSRVHLFVQLFCRDLIKGNTVNF